MMEKPRFSPPHPRPLPMGEGENHIVRLPWAGRPQAIGAAPHPRHGAISEPKKKLFCAASRRTPIWRAWRRHEGTRNAAMSAQCGVWLSGPWRMPHPATLNRPPAPCRRGLCDVYSSTENVDKAVDKSVDFRRRQRGLGLGAGLPNSWTSLLSAA